MTTEALRGTLHDPAHISPSNLIRRIGERYSRYLFSLNPPPLNIQREGPTQRDREIVNSSRNASPQEPKGGISSRDVFLVAGTSLTTAGAVIGGQILINRVFGAEPISEPTPASRNIDSFGRTSFNDDSLIDDRLPRLGAETRQVKPDQTLTNKAAEQIKRNSNPNAIKAKKFDIAPPNRTPSEDMSSQYIPIDQLSTIEAFGDYSRDGTYNHFQPGVGFMLEGQPATPYTTRRVTPKGIELVEGITPPIYPYIGVSGYAIGKEIQPDGSVFLAIYAPGKNSFPNPDGVENPSLALKNFTNDGNEGSISNAIVWIKAENFEGDRPPFSFNAIWQEDSLNRFIGQDKKTNIPEEFFKYVEVGDPVTTVGGILQVPPWAENLLVQNYQERQDDHLAYEEAREKYLNITKSNAATLQRMLEDAMTGGISLEEQFDSKRYVIQVSGIGFVPRD